jgi:hypothetical protein
MFCIRTGCCSVPVRTRVTKLSVVYDDGVQRQEFMFTGIEKIYKEKIHCSCKDGWVLIMREEIGSLIVHVDLMNFFISTRQTIGVQEKFELESLRLTYWAGSKSHIGSKFNNWNSSKASTLSLSFNLSIESTIWSINILEFHHCCWI